MWSFTANLGNFGAATGGSALTEGYYTGIVQGGELTTSSTGRQQIAWKITIPSHGGMIRTWWVGVPQSAEDNVIAYWRAFAEACGYTAAQLGTGALELNESTFQGKTVNFYYMPKNESTGTREKLAPLPQAVWNQRKARFEQGAVAQPGSAQGIQVGAPKVAPTNGTGTKAGGLTSAEVLSQLTGSTVPTLG